MTVDELYILAEKEGVQTFSADLPNAKAAAVSVDGITAIGIDRHLIASGADKLPLAHELAHVLTGAWYDPALSIINIKRMEHRAEKQIVKWFVPEQELKAALHEDVTANELAERFGVSERIIKRAFWLYWRKEA